MKLVFDPMLDSSNAIAEHHHKCLASRGMLFEGIRYQIRQRDRAFITSIVALASAAIQAGSAEGDLRWHSPDQDFAWIAMDNSMVQMDARTALRLSQMALAAMDRAALTARAYKDRVMAGERFNQSEIWSAIEASCVPGI